MKTKIVSIFLIAASLSSLSAKEIDVTSKITEATIYTSNARITRKGKAQLPTGTSEIIFKNLSAKINPNSIQVDGTGSYTILSVKHRNNYNTVESKPRKLVRAEDSLKIVDQQLALQNGLISVYQNEEALLLANKNISGENNGVSAEQLTKMAELFRLRLTDLMKKKLNVNQTITKLNVTKNRLNSTIRELNKGFKKSTGEVVITVLAKNATSANLNVNYLVYNAGWYPSYNIKATSTDKPVELTMRANVHQSSGFDWKNVKLILSTANPNQNFNKPVVYPWRLNFYTPYTNRYNKNKKRSYGEPASAAKADYEMLDGAVEEEIYAAPKLAQSASKYVALNQTQLSNEYKVGIPYSIPTDGKEHIVEIKTYSIDASYRYYCAPKLDKGAYLLARLINWDQLNLVSGEANIFFENSYVGKTHLNTASVNDTLDISMGKDPSVVVERKKLLDFCEKKVIGSNKREKSKYAISVRNSKSKEIKIEIQDQVPLASNNEIIVESVDKGGARLKDDTGILTWELTIPARKTKKQEFGYTVKYPKSKVISNL